MTKKSAHHYHLANENCLLKQKYTELTEKIQLLEEEIQELREQHGDKNNQHANTLFFLQNKNSELSKALVNKTNDNMKLQSQLYVNKPPPHTKKSYNNGDFLSDEESDDSEERAVPPLRPPQPMPPIHIIPTHPNRPKDLDKHWGHHGRHHWGHYGGFPYFSPFWDDFSIYRDVSGNTHHPVHKPMSNVRPNYPPIYKPPKQSLKDFVNPLLSFEEIDRAKKPTHFIPPAIPHPKEE